MMMMNRRRLPYIILHSINTCLFLLLTTLVQSISLSKPGCPQTCGNLTIPYPFGIGSQCSANSSFTLVCSNSTNPPKPILTSFNLEVLEIFLDGTIKVNFPVSPLNCSDDRTKQMFPITTLGTPFTISSQYNILVNLGCASSVWLHSNKTIVGGCTPFCDAHSYDTNCTGVNCCQIEILHRLHQLQYSYQSLKETGNNSVCGYVFPVDKKWFQQEYEKRKGFQNDVVDPFGQEFGFVPLVLEWEADDLVDGFFTGTQCRNGHTEDHSLYHILCSSSYDSIFGYPNGFRYPNRAFYKICTNPTIYSSILGMSYYDHQFESTVGYCACADGFEGNPYLPGGRCSDIDECSNATFVENPCYGGTCVNTNGSYYCDYPDHSKHKRRPARIVNGIKIASITIGSVIGALVLFYGAWRSGNAFRKLIEAVRRYHFYKRNGGLLLEQQLASTENGLEKTKLFGAGELEQATDHYNENRILGSGGQGTVYKGMLTDGKIVAVKKSKKVSEGDLELFINEVVIVSQINHRNVVNLIGCCLETKVPLLVYEFVPNGTLFHHIHEPNEEIPLTWEMRVRIASEVAGALSYMHSASSAPIYHRDIKSTNILLDDKYRAKVSDFGTSRTVSIEQTHVTTRVLGTFGYLDPEYFQSSHYTEKSDVYSFGVVMVELLTGEKAVTSIRAESGKSLAMHFLDTMEENQLFDIIDARVLREGKTEEIEAIAELGRRCLNLNGKRRPTMMEVAANLEGIRRGMQEGVVPLQQSLDHSMDNHSARLYEESLDFSSTSESSMHTDTVTSTA